jgi:hypothetical protein
MLLAGLLSVHLVGESSGRQGNEPLLSSTPPSAPVTLSVSAQPLTEVLRELPTGEHTQLDTTRNTAWDRVTLCVKERPSGELLSDVAELFNYQWERDQNAEPPGKSVLAQSIRARQHEDGLYLDSLDRAAEPLLKLASYTRTPAEKWAQQARDLGGAQPKDVLLREGNLEKLSDPKAHAGLKLLTTLSAPQRQALFENEEIFLPWHGMTSGQQGLARTMVSWWPQYDEHEGSLSEEKRQQKIDAQVAWLKQFGVILSIYKNPVTGAVTYYRGGVGGGHSGFAGFPDTLFKANLLPVRGRPYKGRAGDPPVSYTDLERMPFPEKFRLDPGKPASWSQIVIQLSKHLSMPLYSDDFAGTRDPHGAPTSQFPNPAGLSLTQGLDALCRAHGRLWWRRGDALFFRSRTWFVEKRYEVPPPTLALLSKQVGTLDEMNPAALTTLSRLTIHQLQGLSGATNFQLTLAPRGKGISLQGRDGVFFDTRKAFFYLQLIAALTQSQRREVLSPQGLRYARMNPSQQQALLVIALGLAGRGVLQQLPTLALHVTPAKPSSVKRTNPVPVMPLQFRYADKGRAIRILLPYQPEELAAEAP